MIKDTLEVYIKDRKEDMEENKGGKKGRKDRQLERRRKIVNFLEEF